METSPKASYKCVRTSLVCQILPFQSQILLPRLDGEQVNSTVLNLSNYSTLKINIPSPDVTLVLRMEPSEDLTFKLFLGDKNYPTTADYVAKTQMPHQGSKRGTVDVKSS